MPGAGGIGSMHQATRSLNGWSKTRETRRKAFGLILSRCRRGSTGNTRWERSWRVAQKSSLKAWR